jgi:hypothetical protein
MPCCGWSGAIGRIFKVAQVEISVGECNHCLQRNKPDAGATSGDDRWFGVKRLKRLDPDNLSEEIQTKEELTA